MIFDPNGPPGENWYFLAYFGIVPLEVDEYVLPMIEHLSFAVCFKTCYKKIFENFFGPKFFRIFLLHFLPHYPPLIYYTTLQILHRVRSTADDPGKNQSRRSGAKADDLRFKEDDLVSQSKRSLGQGRRYRPKRTIFRVKMDDSIGNYCVKTDDFLSQRERSSMR